MKMEKLAKEMQDTTSIPMVDQIQRSIFDKSLRKDQHLRFKHIVRKYMWKVTKNDFDLCLH